MGKIAKKNWIDYLYLGLIHESLGNQRVAIGNYKQSIQLQNNTIALVRLAKIYRQNSDWAKAADYFEKALQHDSSLRLVHIYLGECRMRQGLYELAYASLVKAGQFYPQAPGPKEQLIAVKKKLGDKFFEAKKETIEAARRTVRLPSYPPETGAPLARVGLTTGSEEFSFSCAGRFQMTDGAVAYEGEAHTYYKICVSAEGLQLKDYRGKLLLQRFGNVVSLSSLSTGKKYFPFYVLDITAGKGNFWHRQADRAYRGKLEVIRKDNQLTLINVVSVEEYLKGVISAEIPATSASAALRAQAVAARTLAVRNRNRHKKEGFDFCADVHCQVYQGLSAETTATNAAVDETRGMILSYEENPIEAFYHSNSGGCLCADSFGVIEYLAVKPDAAGGVLPQGAFDEELWFFSLPDTFSTQNNKSSARWQRVYDSEDFSLVFGFTLKDLTGIIPAEKGDCFHYKAMQVVRADTQESIEGDVAIRKYFDGLRSSAFKLEQAKSAQGEIHMLLFWGAGFGHGAGMSQEGAMRMAQHGFTFQEILTHYYPRAVLEQAY